MFGKSRTLAIAFTAALVLSSLPAQADSLPKTAEKLTAAQAKALYAGKSSNWEKSRAYFAPDGTVSLFKKDKTVWAEGQWTVNGNKVCMSVNWHDLKDKSQGKHSDCWLWYRDGKRYLTLWSGEKDKTNGYWDGELKMLAKGDKVTKTVAALKAKW